MTTQRSRRSVRGSRRSSGNGSDGGNEGTTGDVPISDPQEFDFLPRREGTPWSPSDVDTAIRRCRELLEDENRDSGVRAWRKGDMFLELYNGFPERVKGFPSFLRFAMETFELSKEDVLEFLRIRRGVPKVGDAANIGRRKLGLGLRLLDKTGNSTFAALRNVALPQADGSTCRFPQATEKQLQEALGLMGKKDDDTPEPAISKTLRSELARKNERVQERRKSDPVFAKAHARYAIRDGEVVFDARGLTAAQRKAVGRFLLDEEG